MSDQKIDIRNERTLLKAPGAHKNAQSGSVVLTLPGDGEQDGWIQTYLLGDGFYLMNINICSTEIPNVSADPEWGRALIINYCFCGRCEVPLENGRTVYLGEGELVIDTGKLKTDFYYPDALYEGLELVIQMDGDWHDGFRVLGEDFRAPGLIYQQVKNEDQPCFYRVAAPVATMMADLRRYMDQDEDRSLVAVKAAEWVMTLARHREWLTPMKKTAYSQSQVTIAKAVQKILMADLSKRYTARELAERFNVSETSLKTYFRHVYGCGYAAYQNQQRMKRAAAMLAVTPLKVAEIATSVGYVSQAKFGKRFKETYGLTPLEYRRAERLKMSKNTEGRV